MDHYRIGVAIMLRDGMSPVLAAISHRLLGVHKSVKDIEGGMNRWKLAIGGVGAAIAGAGIIKGLWSVAKHGDDILDQQDKMIRHGRTQNEVLQVTNDYYNKIAKSIPTTNAADFLRATDTAKIRLGVHASMDESMNVAKHASIVNALVNNATGGKGDKAVDAIIRTAEFAGRAQSEKTAIPFIDELGRSLVAFAGKVDPGTYQKAALMGGIAYKNMSFDAQTRGFLPLVGEMGTRAGNAVDQTYAFMTGRAIMSKMQVQWGEKLGLFTAKDVIKNGMVGFQLKPGAMKGIGKYGAEGNTDPMGFLHEIIKPAVDGYVKAHPNLTTADVTSKLLRNQSQLRAAVNYLYDTNFQTLTNELAGIGKSMPVDQQYKKFTSENPKGVREAFDNQEKAMMQAMGGPLMQAAIPIMRAVTDMFNQIGAFANAHGTAVKIIGEGIAALGVALVAGGGAAILAALGPVGWVTGGIVALGAGIAMLPKGVLTEIGRDLTAIGSAAAYAVKPLQWLAGVIRALANFGSIGGKGGPAFIPGGEGMPALPSITTPGRQGYNAVPPSSGNRPMKFSAAFNVDGRKIAEVTAHEMGKAANGPLQGSAYMDGGATFIPADFSYARG